MYHIVGFVYIPWYPQKIYPQTIVLLVISTVIPSSITVSPLYHSICIYVCACMYPIIIPLSIPYNSSIYALYYIYAYIHHSYYINHHSPIHHSIIDIPQFEGAHIFLLWSSQDHWCEHIHPRYRFLYAYESNPTQTKTT